MKKVLLTGFCFLFFLVSKAQVAAFESLGFATSEKDVKGNFVQIKKWTVQEIHINFDLSQKKVQFFSKGMFDRDTFSLAKEILILHKITAPDRVDDNRMWEFSGKDRSGKECIIRLKLINDEYKMQDGELRIEYLDRAETYKIRTLKPDPTFNKM